MKWSELPARFHLGDLGNRDAADYALEEGLVERVPFSDLYEFTDEGRKQVQAA